MNRLAATVASFAWILAAGCASPASHGDVTHGRDDGPVARAESLAPAAAVDRAAIRAQLAAHRAEQIERLHAYAEAGEFPHNTTVAPSLHMFRDAAGRYCAVANLVHRDGLDDLVAATVRDRNELAIADVHDGEMMRWVLGSGLTQEELVRIQMPAPFIAKPTRKPRPAARIAVAKNDAPDAAQEARMVDAVRAHAARMENELRDGTEASLDVAVERWVAAATSS